jgi:DNA-binding transcriptional ArsR family regulator
MSKLLDKLFGSRTRARLLGWFFAHSGEPYSVRQLASILGDDPSNLSKELAKLEELGILISSRERNLKRFQVNQDCAFGPELKGLVQKTTGIMGRLRSALQAAKGIGFAFVYGSFAKGTENAESDIDLLIVGDIDLDKREYEIKKAEGNAFVQEVRGRDKIWIIGKNDGPEAP